MLNKYVNAIVIVGFFVAMTIQANDEIKVYSEASYPYKNLIHKASSVKILFTDSKDGVICRVNVLLAKEEKLTEKVLVSKKQFAKAPLASCLPRSKAKKILSLAYL